MAAFDRIEQAGCAAGDDERSGRDAQAGPDGIPVFRRTEKVRVHRIVNLYDFSSMQLLSTSFFNQREGVTRVRDGMRPKARRLRENSHAGMLRKRRGAPSWGQLPRHSSWNRPQSMVQWHPAVQANMSCRV